MVQLRVVRKDRVWIRYIGLGSRSTLAHPRVVSLNQCLLMKNDGVYLHYEFGFLANSGGNTTNDDPGIDDSLTSIHTGTCLGT